MTFEDENNTDRNSASSVDASFSILYHDTVTGFRIDRRTQSTRPPLFRVVAGDPVTIALAYAASDSEANEAIGGGRIRVPFICPAHDRRPGGNWRGELSGYEGRLCRRSNLSIILSTPPPDMRNTSHYPIPSTGGILSDSVVVHRGPYDEYDTVGEWPDLPVVSVTPGRLPRVKENGNMYLSKMEKTRMTEKIAGALRICLYHDYNRVVVGDFGLGNGCRNPPEELAEIWRDLLLFHPDLRGQFVYVVFAFEDPRQSTTQCIWEEEARKRRRGAEGLTCGTATQGTPSTSNRPPAERLPGPSSTPTVTDMAIFQSVFDPNEIARVLQRRPHVVEYVT
ncbi:hypothetical protein E4U14_000021 [Claviceps sp. LM454 group G7]|nr:hypothetical protein E4U14_000021 [Claviceps sp. LM454 group G7]